VEITAELVMVIAMVDAMGMEVDAMGMEVDAMGMEVE
jgi:hypothetical protein